MDSGDSDGRDVDDWCLYCKDGGDLIVCDVPNCEKVYHRNCVAKIMKIPTSFENWRCPRHSCSGCKRSPTLVVCYSCPRASCSECLDALHFERIRDQFGFCPTCLELAMYLETLTKKKPKMEDSSFTYSYLKEYYWIIKEKYGFTVDDLVVLKKGREKPWEMKGGKKRRLDQCDEDKAPFQKVKLNSAGTSKGPTSDAKIIVPSLTPNNVQRIYLTRSVVQKLLMEPDSFEEKVRRTFVGIELPKKPKSNKTTRELVQVTGITKTSSQNDQICIKLRAKNRQDDISVDMVSDMDFLEVVCQDLRQQVKDGLIVMPDVDEFKRMAKVLSEVLVDDFIVRETRLFQQRMNRAHDKGRREEFLINDQKKKELQTPQKRLQLISHFQEVDMEELSVDPMPENTENATLKSENFTQSTPNVVALSENNIIDSEDIMEDKKQKGTPPKLSPGSLELKRDKSSGKQQSKKLINMEWRHGQGVPRNKEIGRNSNIESCGVEEALVLSRDLPAEHNRVDAMVEEFEKNCHHVPKDKQDIKMAMDTQKDEVLRIEGHDVAARLASLEEKVDRILQRLETMDDAAEQNLPK